MEFIYRNMIMTKSSILKIRLLSVVESECVIFIIKQKI